MNQNASYDVEAGRVRVAIGTVFLLLLILIIGFAFAAGRLDEMQVVGLTLAALVVVILGLLIVNCWHSHHNHTSRR